MSDTIKLYQQSVRALENTVLGKQATLRLLVHKLKPAGIWKHGPQLLAMRAEVDMLAARLARRKATLKTLLL